MGTNYYWNPTVARQIYGIDDIDLDDPKVHIGKRSAMLGYCKRCGITRAGHTRYIHVDREKDSHASSMYIKGDVCPLCGQPWDNTCTSFTFTMMSHLVSISNLYNIEYATTQQNPTCKPIDVVIDELGVTYTAIRFLDDVLRQCPVQFQDYGRWS